jgi:hypothetical protein
MIANDRATATVVAPGDRRHTNDGTNSKTNYDNEGSDIYVTSAVYRAPSELR